MERWRELLAWALVEWTLDIAFFEFVGNQRRHQFFGRSAGLAVADGNRRELVIVCDENAAAKVYICGSAGAGAGEGLPLAPGQSLTLETAAAVYCRNDTGAAVAVAVAELGWL